MRKLRIIGTIAARYCTVVALIVTVDIVWFGLDYNIDGLKHELLIWLGFWILYFVYEVLNKKEVGNASL